MTHITESSQPRHLFISDICVISMFSVGVLTVRSVRNRFEGTFKEGNKHGPGWYRTTDGTWFEGEWENGARCRASERIPYPPYYESEAGEAGSQRPAAEQLPAMDSTVSWESVDIRTSRPDAQPPKDKRKPRPPLPAPRGSSLRCYSGPTRHSRDGKRPGSAAESRSSGIRHQVTQLLLHPKLRLSKARTLWLLDWLTFLWYNAYAAAGTKRAKERPGVSPEAYPERPGCCRAGSVQAHPQLAWH